MDLSGFENCIENGFEQLLINLTNEKLQNLINKRLIQHEAELYELEGIHVERVSYESNDDLLDMVFQVCILI